MTAPAAQPDLKVGTHQRNTAQGYYALVTGSAVRVGRVIATHLAAEGYNIVLHCNKSVAEAQKAQKEIASLYGVDVKVVQADFCNNSETQSLIPKLMAEHNVDLRVLVNSASSFWFDSLEVYSEEQWLENFHTNLRAPYLLSCAFANYVHSRQGSRGTHPSELTGWVLGAEVQGGQDELLRPKFNIVNIVDSWVEDYDERFLSYNLAKLGLIKLTKTMALKYAPLIRVNGVAPGLTLKPHHMPEERFAAMYAHTPSQRGVSPHNIAQTVSFILNNDDMFGSIVTVDGGKSLINKSACTVINAFNSWE